LYLDEGSRAEPQELFDCGARVPYSFCTPAWGDHLIYAIAYALIGVRIPNRRGGLSEAERYQIAETAVAKLVQNGDPLRLKEELPTFFHGPPTQGS
jgi:hypothetical protein